MAKARKLPSGSWRVLVYEGKDETGKRKYASVTAPTKREAEKLAALQSIQKNNTPGITIGEAIDRYIQAKEAILSPKTIREYKAIRKRVFQGIMGLQIKDLTNERMQIAVNQYAATVSAKTVKNAVGLVTASLALFAPDFRVRVSFPRASKTPLSIPQETQIKALIEDAKEPLKTAILLATALGLRRSEICALTWADLDTKKKKLAVNKAIVMTPEGGWHVKGTKTESGTRTLDVPPFLMDHLKQLPRDGERIIQVTPDSITYRFITLRKKHGLDIRFHDLRHYYASLLLALGIPDKYAMQRMGHATTYMLKNVYQHLMQDKQQEVTDAINQALTDRFNPS
ncbi:MAG: site-specific integrase [Clostridiales bacterium]|nr:site-specific integrase [Clostridiales bacterium]